jgi:hypothetical protein
MYENSIVGLIIMRLMIHNNDSCCPNLQCVQIIDLLFYSIIIVFFFHFRVILM